MVVVLLLIFMKRGIYSKCKDSKKSLLNSGQTYRNSQRSVLKHIAHSTYIWEERVFSSSCSKRVTDG